MPEAINSGTGMPDAHGRPDEIHPAPRTERLRRYRPRLRYELIGCGQRQPHHQAPTSGQRGDSLPLLRQLPPR